MARRAAEDARLGDRAPLRAEVAAHRSEGQESRAMTGARRPGKPVRLEYSRLAMAQHSRQAPRAC
ncbi:hypothetical protein MPLB_730023 [Mesorhizobium sp. ORS 3324]|nr:hypothetical protein MPLB_730023 [Mesorhizobium sp. ORS 3324]